MLSSFKFLTRVSPKSLLMGLSVFLFFFVLSIILWLALRGFSWFVLLPLSISCIVIIQIENHYRHRNILLENRNILLENLRDLKVQQQANYQQVESLFYIFSLLKPKQPLPPMRGWAIFPDFARLLMSTIYQSRPKVVLEAGCGISTLITAYCLDVLGEGHVFSLEHDSYYAQACKAQVEQHNLQDRVTILYAPLKSVEIEQRTWSWYDTNVLQELPRDIDLLSVDGPPGSTQPLARYPALPILFDHLRNGTIILLDDGNREDEQAMVEQWKQEFNFSITTKIATEKGAFTLKLKK